MIAFPTLVGIRFLNFLNLQGVIVGRHGSMSSNFLLNRGKLVLLMLLRLGCFLYHCPELLFSWFSALAPNSIFTWSQLEHKFHEHFYARDNELRLSNLTSVRQKHDEPIADYIRRFRDTKNRCYGVIVSEKDLDDLDHNGLHSHLKDKLEGHEFF
jgi:hypothetical protein